MVIGEYMTNQNYLMVNQSTNVVDNICLWDGNTETWQPPSGFLMLVQATTPAMVWKEITEKDPVTGKIIVLDYVLAEQIGAGNINFTWDGSVLTTNQTKPSIPTQL